MIRCWSMRLTVALPGGISTNLEKRLSLVSGRRALSWNAVNATSMSSAIFWKAQCLTDNDRTSRTFGPGDSFVIAAGYQGTWENLTQVRKIFFFLGCVP